MSTDLLELYSPLLWQLQAGLVVVFIPIEKEIRVYNQKGKWSIYANPIGPTCKNGIFYFIESRN